MLSRKISTYQAPEQREFGEHKEQRGTCGRSPGMRTGTEWSWEQDPLSHCGDSGFILLEMRSHWKFLSTGVM